MTLVSTASPFGIVKGKEVAKSALRTKLCDMLDIEYPIVLAGMGGVSGPTIVERKSARQIVDQMVEGATGILKERLPSGVVAGG